MKVIIPTLVKNVVRYGLQTVVVVKCIWIMATYQITNQKVGGSVKHAVKQLISASLNKRTICRPVFCRAFLISV